MICEGCGHEWEPEITYRHRLLCGDATDEHVISTIMCGQRAHCVLTDPPYNYDYTYGGEYDDKKEEEEWEGFLRRWFPLARKYGGRVVFTPGLKNLPVYLRNFSPTWICAWIKKNAMTASKIGNLSVWEPIVFDADDYDWEPIIVDGRPRKRVKRDVYEYPVRMQSDVADHPCPKLLVFWEALLQDFSLRGDCVFDMFLGSGTTIIACERLGRYGRGVELYPPYVAVCLERFYQMTGDMPVRIMGGI